MILNLVVKWMFYSFEKLCKDQTSWILQSPLQFHYYIDFSFGCDLFVHLLCDRRRRAVLWIQSFSDSFKLSVRWFVHRNVACEGIVVCKAEVI